MIGRLLCIAGIVCAASVTDSRAQTRIIPFYAAPLPHDSFFILVGQFRGALIIDTSSVTVRVDSAKLYIRNDLPTRSPSTLGGITATLSETLPRGGWLGVAEASGVEMHRYLATGDTLRLRHLIFRIPRPPLKDLSSSWLTFELMNGQVLIGRPDTGTVGYTYMHATRTLGDAPLPSLERDVEPDSSEWPRLRPGTCGRYADVRARGRVLVEVTVDSTGRIDPTGVRVLRAPDSISVDPAVRAALQCRFRPARIDGRRTRVRVTLPIILHD